MQCCQNSNNDKLALLDTIYNQLFKHFTHLIYIYIYTIYFKVFLMSILMSFDIDRITVKYIYECNNECNKCNERNVLLTKECDSLV